MSAQVAQQEGKRKALRGEEPIRLDRLANAYGPSIAIGEALASSRLGALDGHLLRSSLRDRIADHLGVAPAWIVLGNGADELVSASVAVAGRTATDVRFPPAEPAELVADRGRPIELRRDGAFRPDVDLESAAELPPACVALVGSPSNPSGTLLPVAEAVRLGRTCATVVVDERHGGYGARSLLPIVREFDNMVLVQSLETWAALEDFPIAWAVGHPRLIELLAREVPQPPALGAVLAATATFDDLAWVSGTVRRVREERSRLYRMLRKSNLVQPLPSWANFMLARVERGNAGFVAAELANRAILVARPAAPELAQFLRIGVGKPEHTDRLRQALIEVALLVD